MRKVLIAVVVVALVLGVTGSSFAGLGLSVGTRYHVSLKDIPDTDFDKSHLSFLAGLRHRAGLLILDVDVDYRAKMGDVDYSLTPKISFLVDILGTGIYAGAGIEETYVQWASGDAGWSDLNYVLQAGTEIALEPLSLILDAYYESANFSLKEIDTSFITFGARLIWYL